MATIRPVPSGKYQAIIRRDGISQSRTFTTQSDAAKWARMTESSIEKGDFVDTRQARKITLRQALERYKSVSELNDGAAQELVRINSWMRDPLAKKTLAALTGKDLAEWRDERLKYVSPSTTQKDLAIISHLYTTARKEWHIKVSNPVADMTMPSVDNARDRRLEEDEELRLLKALKPVAGRSPLMIPLVQLAIETAGRQSELLSLKWQDVDTSEGGRQAHFRGKVRRDGKERTKQTNKKLTSSGDAKTRKVPLSRHAMAVLDDMFKWRDQTDDRVFPISDKVVQRAFGRACDRAKIVNLTFHDLRHEACTRLADEKGIPLEKLMKITGHKTTRMLMRYYHPKTIVLAKMLD